MSIISSNIAIKADKLNVHYTANDYRINTLKEYVTKKLKGDLGKRSVHALKDFSAEIGRGECVGIIGHNGSGKSTLLKTIAEVIEPSSGLLQVNGSVVPLIELGAGFDPELTGRENIFLNCSLLGLTRQEIRSLIPKIIDFSELEDVIDAPVKTYSSGMYMRLGFACSTVMHADIILIDEILAVGDLNFQKKCMDRLNKLKESGSTIVIVSHDMSTLRNIAERMIIIDRGEKAFDGAIEAGVDVYADIMEKKILQKMTSEEKSEYIRKQKLSMSYQPKKMGEQVEILEAAFNGGAALIASGEDLTLTISLVVKEDLEQSPTIGFALMSHPKKVRIMGLNSKLARQMRKTGITSKGHYTVSFSIEALQLATGEYTVLAAVHNPNLTRTLDIKEFEVFRIVNDADEHNFDGDLLASRDIVRECTIQAHGEL